MENKKWYHILLFMYLKTDYRQMSNFAIYIIM